MTRQLRTNSLGLHAGDLQGCALWMTCSHVVIARVITVGDFVSEQHQQDNPALRKAIKESSVLRLPVSVPRGGTSQPFFVRSGALMFTWFLDSDKGLLFACAS